MKEMLKSKFMIGFVVFVVGFSYINSAQINVLKENNNNQEIVYVDIK